MKVAVEELRSLSQAILVNRDLAEIDAHIVTDILLEAELRGRSTHGLVRLPRVAEHCASGARKPMLLPKDSSGFALIDGQENLGYLVAHRSARLVVGKADRVGVGVVGSFNTGHCGMLGYYASMIADAGLVGLVMCDTGPRIVPWGGTEPVLGTNPIAAGFPAPQGQVLIDLSSAAITNGEILMALKEEKELPAGRALDQDGNLTTDPIKASKGAVLPFGGHKGYSLAVMIQILSGVLVGASPIPQQGQNYGIFMLAIDPTIFLDRDLFQAGVGELLQGIKSARRAKEVAEILVPGERGFREREMRLIGGIDLNNDLLDELNRLRR